MPLVLELYAKIELKNIEITRARGETPFKDMLLNFRKESKVKQIKSNQSSCETHAIHVGNAGFAK